MFYLFKKEYKRDHGFTDLKLNIGLPYILDNSNIWKLSIRSSASESIQILDLLIIQDLDRLKWATKGLNFQRKSDVYVYLAMLNEAMQNRLCIMT